MDIFRHKARTHMHRCKTASLHPLSPTAFSPSEQTECKRIRYVTPAVSTVELIVSEGACATFSSAPGTLAGSDSPGPAATVTTFYNSLPSICCHVDFMNIPRHGGKAFALFMTRPYWVNVIFAPKKNMNKSPAPKWAGSGLSWRTSRSVGLTFEWMWLQNISLVSSRLLNIIKAGPYLLFIIKLIHRWKGREGRPSGKINYYSVTCHLLFISSLSLHSA